MARSGLGAAAAAGGNWADSSPLVYMQPSGMPEIEVGALGARGVSPLWARNAERVVRPKCALIKNY